MLRIFPDSSVGRPPCPIVECGLANPRQRHCPHGYRRDANGCIRPSCKCGTVSELESPSSHRINAKY